MRNISKIGRLPKGIRDELGRRIENGELGKDILAWLNSQEEVRDVLDYLYAGRLVTEQNLSDWRQSGHLQWLCRQEARDSIRQVTDHAEDVDDETGDHNLSDSFATVLASEMTRLAMALLEPETDPEKRWRRLCQIHREFSQMRRDDHRAVRTEIRRQRWEHEVQVNAEEDAARQDQADKERSRGILLAPFHNEAMAKSLGGGKSGELTAEALHRVNFNLPLDDLAASIPLIVDSLRKKLQKKPANSHKSPPIAANRAKKIKSKAGSTRPPAKRCKRTGTRENSRLTPSRSTRQPSTNPAIQEESAVNPSSAFTGTAPNVEASPVEPDPATHPHVLPSAPSNRDITPTWANEQSSSQ